MDEVDAGVPRRGAGVRARVAGLLVGLVLAVAVAAVSVTGLPEGLPGSAQHSGSSAGGYSSAGGHSAAQGRSEPAALTGSRPGSPTERAWQWALADMAESGGVVRELLASQETALRHRDRAAFLATMDVRAAGFRRAQGEVFDRLAQVPVTDWRLEVASGGGAASADRTASSASVERAWRVPVTVSYRLDGFDRARVSREVVMTVVHRPEGWRIADEVPRPGRAEGADLWQQSDVTVVRHERSLVLGAGDRSELERLADEADRAVAAVTHVWGDAWPRRVVLLVPRTVSDMAALLGTERPAVERLAAVTTAEPASGGLQAAERIVVNPALLSRLSVTGRRVVLAHEVTHVAARRDTTYEVPTWLAEGMADYVAYRDAGVPERMAAGELFADVRQGRVPQRLPSADDFEGTADALPQAYEQAWLACRMLAGRYGEPALLDFYRTTAREGLAAAFRRLGTTAERFTREWRSGLVERAA